MFSIIGISKLEVENSFINYFNKNTEIYKGMKLIDEKLGGTTPLEIILKFPEKVEVKSGEELRTKLLQELTQTESASAVAIGFIKEELKRVF